MRLAILLKNVAKVGQSLLSYFNITLIQSNGLESIINALDKTNLS